MNLLRAPHRRPARPTAVVMAIALTLGAQLVGSWSAPVTRAADPVPSAEASPVPLGIPSAAPLPSDPIPTIDPSPIDTTPPDPTADPGPTPEPTLAPDATQDPNASPAPYPGPPLPSSDPAASPDPTQIPWALSNGQQAGGDAPAPIPLYRLKAATTAPEPSAIHTGGGIGSPDCAACHAAHTAQSPDLLNAPSPGSTLCLRCHSGSGSPFDVAAQLGAAPANDPATDSYFRHLVEDGSPRQVTCADCHNPHDANATRPVMTTGGWTASGDIRGATGVGVANGATGTAPIYSPISRSNGASLAFEYQLCLACHSGATSLPSAVAAHPSWWALDKGIELNPANASYHPIEAAGRNQSTQMAASLAGTSPFKAWDYTIDSTIRCASCHGDPASVDQTGTATPKRPDADAREATHGSPNRGLLIAPYRDRVLKPLGEAYDPNDFGLCYLCHAEAPFVNPNENPSAPNTAFSLHGFHLVNLPGTVDGGTSIDHRGDGEGLAICAECHFRIHSTAIAYRPGDIAAVARSTGSSGLVNFAPNVAGLGLNAPVWTTPGSNGSGSCALTCHGFTHLAADTTYRTAPGTGFSASLTAGPVGPLGLTIQFTDQTRYVTAGGATWLWDFGDGSTSTQVSPLHVYLAPGTYTVTLTVRRTADGLSATMTRAAYITVVP